MQQTQTAYAAASKDPMRDLAALALETLRKLLADPETPPAVWLKAALAVLQRLHFPNQGRHLPERIESPRERQVVDGLAAMEADQRAMRMTDSAEAPAARNAPCPCGSDKKYKRCCATAAA